MFPVGPNNTYIPSWDPALRLPEPDPADLRDGYNVIDKAGKVIGTFPDVCEALSMMGAGGGVAMRRHPPAPANRYVRVTKPEE